MRISHQGHWINFHFEIAKMEKMVGISSQIGDSDKHIVMWDFDEVSLDVIKSQLLRIQDIMSLPKIRILATSKNSYHAYCFTSLSWIHAYFICSEAPSVDKTWLNLSLARGHFVLRISAKHGYPIKYVTDLPSDIDDYVSQQDIRHVEHYWSY